MRRLASLAILATTPAIAQPIEMNPPGHLGTYVTVAAECIPAPIPGPLEGQVTAVLGGGATPDEERMRIVVFARETGLPSNWALLTPMGCISAPAVPSALCAASRASVDAWSALARQECVQ